MRGFLHQTPLRRTVPRFRGGSRRPAAWPHSRLVAGGDAASQVLRDEPPNERLTLARRLRQIDFLDTEVDSLEKVLAEQALGSPEIADELARRGEAADVADARHERRRVIMLPRARSSAAGSRLDAAGAPVGRRASAECARRTMPSSARG